MIRAKSAPIAIAALLALGGTGAFAQAVQQRPAQPPTTLEQAVQAAEQATGGRASNVEMETERGADVYEIKTLTEDGSAEVHVELASGEVVRVDKPGFIAAVGNIFDREDLREDRADLARLEASPMTLVAATAAAERETGGRAVEAKMKSRYGVPFFQVAVIKDLAKQRVVVDPATGKVYTLPRETRDDDDD